MVAAFLVWLWYPLTVVALVLPASIANPDPGLKLVPFVVLHVGIAALAVSVQLATRDRAPIVRRVAWSLVTAVCTPAVFSALGWVLPMVHPEPWEWRCVAFDRWLCGEDPIPVLQATLTPLRTEVLQACYASFYLLPAFALIGVMLRRNGRAFDRGLVTIAFCFQLSYLGYLVWPTLGPNRIGLWGQPIVGLGLAERIHGWIAVAEANHWDCFPSGHTMLSLVTVRVAFTGARPVAWALVPVAACVVYATMALCYHYLADLLAGVVGAGLGLWLSRSLCDAAEREALGS
jgi:membrane-associated phospholipid phosphatase